MEEGKCGIPSGHLPRFSHRMSTELLTEPKPEKRSRDYLEGIQRCFLCLQGGVRKAKAHLKSKLAKADKDKKKGYYKDVWNERKTKKTVEPLLSDTGDIVGGACKAQPWQKGLVITNVTTGICGCVMQNCLTGHLPKIGHVEEQEDHQLD